MVKALAAGAVLVAAALPLAAANVAGAAVPAASYLALTQVGTIPATADLGASGQAAIFGPGWSGNGTIYISSADSANLSNATVGASVSTTATGVTFGAGSETVGANGTQITTSISSTSAVAAGFYPVTVTDASGTVTIPDAFYVDSLPTITSTSPATMPAGPTVPVSLTGTGFTSGATATLTLGTNTITLATLTGSTTLSNSAVNTSGLPAGLYAATVMNGDGSVVSSATVGLTLTGPTITTVSPASLAIPAASATTTVTLTGTDFQSGGYVTIPTTTGVTLGVTSFVSSTSVTVPVTVSSSATATQLTLTVHNPDGSSAVLAGGLGIGEASTATPTVTGVSPTLPTLGVGSSASLTITGTGFGAGSTTVTINFLDSTGQLDSNVACSSMSVISDTQLNCIVQVSAYAAAGAHSVVVEAQGGTAFSKPFANALTIAGAVITSVSPAAVNADYGTPNTFTLTGTGFSATDSYVVYVNGLTSGNVSATATYVSSTTMTINLTGNSTITAGQNLEIYLDDTTTTQFSPATVTVVLPIHFTSVSYAGSTTGVGVGAFAQPVTFVGTGFQPGVTVTFAPTSGVTATVASVTPTAINATIAVAAGATTGLIPFTLTNTNGATATGSLKIDAGAGAIVANPAAVLAGAKPATITLTSAGIAAGATVTSSSPLVTIAAVVATTGSVTFTAAAPSITGTVAIGLTLNVANPDGGTGSVGFSVNPGPTVTGTYYIPTFSTNVEVTVTGTGFEAGMSATSSNSAYTVSVAAVSSATSVTLLVSTTSAATSGTNSSIVLTNPDSSTVTFVLNGGPAPTTVVAGPHCNSVSGSAVTGKTSVLVVSGSGFYGQPTIATNGGPGTRATVSHDNGRSLTIRFTVRGGRRGSHVMRITLANGKACQIHYNQI